MINSHFKQDRSVFISVAASPAQQPWWVTNDSIFLKDFNERYILVNQAALDPMGKFREAFAMKQFLDGYSEEDARMFYL